MIKNRPGDNRKILTKPKRKILKRRESCVSLPYKSIHSELKTMEWVFKYTISDQQDPEDSEYVIVFAVAMKINLQWTKVCD